MKLFSKLAIAAGVATLSAAAMTSTASATSYDHGHRSYGHGLNGHFNVYVRDCPDLREDRRDRRVNYGRADRREDRRDRRVISCPSSAFDYVPTRREWRQGRTGDRIRVNRAYLDRRSGTYFADTRFGPVPVYVQRGRAPDNRGYRDRRGHGYGYDNDRRRGHRH